MYFENGKRCLVGLQSCPGYDHDLLKITIDQLFRAIGFKLKTGATILIKPNLVSAVGGSEHLACSSPQFVAAAVEWCLDQGAKVKVGDSPAFGSAQMVMQASGITEILKSLKVELVNFNRSRPIKLNCGLTVPIAEEALNCDVLLNLPRVKAHNQLYVSLAVKNYFGVVAGWRKAMHHVVNGDVGTSFEELLVDLPGLFPASCSLLDGIVAMHRTGPIKGDPYSLKLIGASFSPEALDMAIMKIINADFIKSQLVIECFRRSMPGTKLAGVEFPLQNPDDLMVEDFVLPARLNPVTFNPARIFVGACKRLVTRIVNT